MVFHHLLYCDKNVTFSGCISISNLQSSNRELAFVLETLFVVLYMERLLKVADLNSDRKVILLSTGKKKKEGSSEGINTLYSLMFGFQSAGEKDCLLDLVVQCHGIDFKIWVSLNFLRHYKGPQHEYFNNLQINY